MCAGGLFCFVTGVVIATGPVGFARQRKLQSEYALPLLLAALLLLFVGRVDAQGTVADGLELFAVLMVLCLSMGIPPRNARLALLNLLVLYFFLGLAVGWLGFEQMGVAAILPFAIALAAMALVSVIDDLSTARR